MHKELTFFNEAMLNAGTPCPINGKIGTEARREWEQRDLAQVEGAYKIGDTGFYAAPINLKQESPGEPAQTSDCAGYTGSDPIVRSRMKCQ